MNDVSQPSRYDWLINEVSNILETEVFLENTEITQHEVDVIVSVLKNSIPLGFNEDYEKLKWDV